MINIKSNNFNKNEKEYVFDYIFRYRLGVEYTTDFSGDRENNFIISCNKLKIIEIRDAFFNIYPKDLQYLTRNSVPENVRFMTGHPFLDRDIPVIFGDIKFQIKENSCFIGIDIIAGIFFCLSRWEEYVSDERDIHGRFPGNSSWIVRNGIELRPVVDEYIDFLRAILVKSGYSIPKNKEKYEAIICHDVDFMWKYPGSMKTIKSLGGDILKRRDPGKFARNLKNRMKNEADPYDTFDFLMGLSEKMNLRSQFNFIPVNTGSYPATYDIKEKSIIELIHNMKDRGHTIGIHPSYDSYMNPEKLTKELEIIREIDPMVNSGRQHFLRFAVPDTWNHWAGCGLSEDSSLGYEDCAGFRCGTTHRYQVFDFLERKTICLYETPLLAMDVSLFRKFKNKENIVKGVSDLVAQTRLANGRFVLLWHNSTFDEFGQDEYMDLYRIVLEMIK